MIPRTLLCLAALSAPLSAQWSDDPAANLVVSDAPSDQAQAKLEPTADGGCWISWFDGIASGWDVRLQRLDVGGVPQLVDDGVLVADRGFSSTQDYGLDQTADGDALLAYRTDAFGGTQIAASRVAPDGTDVWGGPVQLTSTGSFVAAPKIAGTDDGRALVAWTQDASVVLRRLDASGSPVGSALAFTPASGTYSVADLHAVGDDVIVSFVHQTGGFGSPRRLLTQKIDAAGALAWGPAHVPVFTTGSLQFGNFPAFVTDDAGGAVFSWYDAGSLQLQCYVQRILSDGSPGFAAGGVAVSTDATRVRVSPSAAHDPASDEVTVFWVEQSSNQAQDGIWGQRFDAAGNRLWGSSGATLVPLGGDDLGAPLHTVNGDGSLVVWDRAPSFGTDVILGALVDDSGAITTGPFDVASTPSSKARPTLGSSASGSALLAWQDDRADAGDILATAIHGDGSLGQRWSDLGGGTVGVAGQPLLVGSGPLTAGSPLGATLDHAAPGAFVLLWVSLASTPINIFGGTLHGLPQSLELILPADGDGQVSLSAPFPAGVPAAVPMAFQFLCQDGTVFFGKTLSNGVLGVTP